MNKLFYCLLLMAAAVTLDAAVVPGTVFSDHMVLQRERRVPVWGKAAPGEKVTVEFAGQKVSGTAGKDGAWRVNLSPLKTESKGQIMKISGKDSVVEFKDVLVGEVWFCAGQSNMYLPVIRPTKGATQINGPALAAKANYPLIRFVTVPRRWSLYPRPDWLEFKWEVMSPETVGPFSAVGFFFGKRLMEELNIPIGLIHASWGGSRIEPWIAPDGYKMVPQGAECFRQVETRTPGTKLYKKQITNLKKAYDIWMKKLDKAVAEETVPPRPPKFPAEFTTVETRTGNRTPSAYHNSMVLPLMPYAMRGVIWYQGCSNIGDGDNYRWKLEALYKGWQKRFENPDLKFYMIQLAPYAPAKRNPYLLPDMQLAQQRYADSNPNAALVVINDVGNLNDIHPTDKTLVGLRAANLALKYDYGRKDLKAESPRAIDCRLDGKRVVLTFKDVEKWVSKDPEIKYFEIAGKDGKFQRAKAEINGTKIVLSAKVKKPVKVRYSWNHSCEAELFNEAGLPLGAFMCDVK